MKSAKHIHFIGICGVAMSALALAFKRQGWNVTGSDVGFYPPISTHLKEAGVAFYPGWHPEKVGRPNLVVVGNVAGSDNSEWRYVKERGLAYKSYPEVVSEYIIQKNSIVCAGTYGKTSSTALLAWILTQAGVNPSYMFGGLSPIFPAAKIMGADVHYRPGGWSVVEGDEYKTARWDDQPKFNYYRPTHLLLTSIIWDHADLYPTEASYRRAFFNLFGAVSDPHLKIISEQARRVLAEGMTNHQNGAAQSSSETDKFITYGRGADNDYMYTNVVQSVNGTDFDIIHDNITYPITTTALGDYMADNITGCFALAQQIGLRPEKIINSIKSFAGLKRRLEKRYAGAITVCDDIAHSPAKAKSVLATLREIYRGKIIAVFEPNTGNRRPEAVPGYHHAFDNADEVIIPRLTKIKQKKDGGAGVLAGGDLAKIIGRTHRRVHYFEDDTALTQQVWSWVRAGDVVVFMGSHGFRGMIEQVISLLPPLPPRPGSL